MADPTEQIPAALRALPRSADAIAEHLHAQGVKGTRASTAFCPLAVYLRRQGAPRRVRVFGAASGVFCGGGRWRLAPGAAAFVRRFDNGRYSHLYATSLEVALTDPAF